MRTSKDFEDVVYLLDSRMELEDEVMRSPADVQGYLRDQFSRMLKRRGLFEAMAGHLSPSIATTRAEVLIERVREMAR